MYRSASRYRERDRSIDRSFGVDGSRLGGGRDTPCFPRRARGPRSCPPHLFLSFRSAFYRHSPRSILSADNASASLRFRGGGVAVLAIDRSSKDRYFRQGVNRYRESRLRSSSSKLMQHLTFRNIFLSRGLRSRLLSFLLSVLSYHRVSLPLSPSHLLLISSSSLELPIRRCSTIACPSLSFLLDRTSCWSETTWLDLPSRQVSSHRCETRNALLQEFTIVRASSFCPPTLRSLCISYGFLSFSRHPGKTFRNTCSATLRDAPWNVKRLAYIRLYPFSTSFFSLSLCFSFPPPPSLASPSRTRTPSILSSFVDSSHLSLSPSLFRASSETC